MFLNIFPQLVNSPRAVQLHSTMTVTALLLNNGDCILSCRHTIAQCARSDKGHLLL